MDEKQHGDSGGESSERAAAEGQLRFYAVGVERECRAQPVPVLYARRGERADAAGFGGGERLIEGVERTGAAGEQHASRGAVVQSHRGERPAQCGDGEGVRGRFAFRVCSRWGM